MGQRLSISWRRFRQTLVFTVVLFSFAVTALLTSLVALSFIEGGPVRLYFDGFGERALELGLLAVVVGTMPFVLLILDESLREG